MSEETKHEAMPSQGAPNQSACGVKRRFSFRDPIVNITPDTPQMEYGQFGKSDEKISVNYRNDTSKPDPQELSATSGDDIDFVIKSGGPKYK